ncbi:MAG: amidohydrolase family protein, partial [Spirochaetales bacterium]|nr:amidohydrolase family protein [Candidatus Physcosoma equi]
MKNTSFVLKGNIIYNDTRKSFRVVEKGYLVCVDGISKGVYETLPEEYSSLPQRDYGERLIVPGLVDLHFHAPQFAFRGTGMDLELMEWLDENAFPEETRFQDTSYAEKAYGIVAEIYRKGATTRGVCFASRHTDSTLVLMEKMEEAGLVTYGGKVNMNRLAPEALVEKSTEESVSETLRWLEAAKGRFQHTKPIITPRFTPSCTDDLMEKLGEIRKEYDLPSQPHLPESFGEIETVKKLVPSAPFYGEAYNMFGLFGGDHKCIMAHCVHCSDPEIALMKKNHVFVAHCPECNANISSGISPVRKYLEAGLDVGLGSDVAGGTTESIFASMIEAIRVSKLYWRIVDSGKAPLTFPEAFYLATQGGGKFFGKVGSFEDGYELDAIVLDDKNLPYPRELTPLQRLE